MMFCPQIQQHNQQLAQSGCLSRRCTSYTNLASLGPNGGGYDSSSDSECENPQPIKRSRSDQNLCASAGGGRTSSSSGGGVQRRVGRGSSGSGNGGGTCVGSAPASQAPQYASLNSAQLQLSYGATHSGPYMHSQFGRAQRIPSLPVVLSDVGSSTNSLLSLDSEVTRSASQQHLNSSHLGESAVAAAAAAAGGLARSASSGTAEAIAAATAAAAAGTSSSGKLGHNSSSSGFLCSLNPVSSAASLTAAQLWSRGGYDMTRTTSDASLSSGGYSAAASSLLSPAVGGTQQGLGVYPALMSGSTTSGAADGAVNGTTLLADALHGTGMDVLGLGSCSTGHFKPGLSIQQQKQASFHGPPQPTTLLSAAAAAGVVSAGLGSSSWGMRQVNSRDSLYSSESITSVEAGERLAGVRFGLQPRSNSLTLSPAQEKQGLLGGQGPAVATTQLPPLSPPYTAAVAANGATAAGQLPSASSLAALSGGAGGVGGVGGGSSSISGFGRPPVPASAGGSPAAAGTAGMQSAGGWGGSSNATSPGVMSESESGTIAGASPAIELQSMGSVLGGDGQWLLGELSTGAIGALSPTGLLLREPHAEQGQHSVQQQQQPVTSVAMAAPVSLSRGLPATSSSMAASCSLPLGGAPSGAFGFPGGAGFGAGGLAGAAAAAAAAKLCLFDGGNNNNSATSTAAGFGTQTACGAHGGSANGRGVSSPLPRMDSVPPRPSPSYVGGRLMQMQSSLQQPYRPSQHDGNQWSFARRHASFDCARTSLSSRRRGSLELNMPWRKTLDAAIAAAESSATGRSGPTTTSPGSDRDMATTPRSNSSSKDADADAAAETAVGETEATFGSGAVAPPWQQRLGAGGPSSQLDLLMPLPEVDDETHSLASPRGGAVGPGSLGSGGGRASYDADSSTSCSDTSGRRSSSSGGSVAADHDLPGSTNIGGYIGGSDILGLARHSLDSPTAAAAAAAAAALAASAAAAMPQQQQQQQQPSKQQQQHNSYGLEFDGAVMMETVAAMPDASPFKPAAQQHHDLQQQQHGTTSALSLHSMQDQVKVVVADDEEDGVDGVSYSPPSSTASDEVLGNEAHASPSSSSGAEDAPAPLPMQQQQQQQMAGKRAAPEASRKAAAAAAAAEVSTFMSSPSSALGLDGPGGVGVGADLQSFPSTSSISSRGSPGLYYNRRGAGNGASRDLELFVRLNRARQTLDFAKRQAQAFAELDRAELTVWQAMDLLDGMQEFEAGLMQAAAGSGSGGGGGQDDASALTPDMSLREHAFQVAELCRLSFPDKPWMALVGLLHGLGKVLAHPMWGSQPQWAVAGESYPVGCKFAPQISASEFFSANPDRRRRTYSTTLGVYQEHCGLRNVYMSWGAAEYLYMLLVLNQTQLPEEALFMIRYQRCFALTRPGGAYRQLMTSDDRQLLSTLAAFQHITQYKRVQLPPGALQGQQLYDYYSGLINSYMGEEALFW